MFSTGKVVELVAEVPIVRRGDEIKDYPR